MLPRCELKATSDTSCNLGNVKKSYENVKVTALRENDSSNLPLEICQKIECLSQKITCPLKIRTKGCLSSPCSQMCRASLDTNQSETVPFHPLFLVSCHLRDTRPVQIIMEKKKAAVCTKRHQNKDGLKRLKTIQIKLCQLSQTGRIMER